MKLLCCFHQPTRTRNSLSVPQMVLTKASPSYEHFTALPLTVYHYWVIFVPLPQWISRASYSQDDNALSVYFFSGSSHNKNAALLLLRQGITFTQSSWSATHRLVSYLLDSSTPVPSKPPVACFFCKGASHCPHVQAQASTHKPAPWWHNTYTIHHHISMPELRPSGAYAYTWIFPGSWQPRRPSC